MFDEEDTRGKREKGNKLYLYDVLLDARWLTVAQYG